MNAVLLAMSVPQSVTFAELLDRLYREQYTGAVILHCVHGVARKVELPREPVRIALDVVENSA